jgi:quercetin dioxygenase-like cupin family protein
MKIQNVPFNITDWNEVVPVEYLGKKGVSFWRTIESGNIRVRIVEYSPDFEADHYCQRGHVIFVLDGELFIKLKNGDEHQLLPGMSFLSEDDIENPHLAYSIKGAKVFIVD